MKTLALVLLVAIAGCSLCGKAEPPPPAPTYSAPAPPPPAPVTKRRGG